MAKYLPCTTWLSGHIHSALFLSPLCSAQMQWKLAWSVRHGTKLMIKKKFSPQCQRLQEFNNLVRLGFAFLKPLGQHLETHVYSKRSTDWKNKCCQMIFVLAVIWRKHPQNSTGSPCRRLWAGVPYSLPFSLLSNGRNFNCQKLRRPNAWWMERKRDVSREWCGKSTTSTLTLINAQFLIRAVITHYQIIPLALNLTLSSTKRWC